MFLSNIKRMDWVLNGAVLVSAAFSLLAIVSVAPNLFWPQALWFLLAFVLIIILSRVDWRPLANYRWLLLGIYLAAIILLLLTYFFAPVIRGSRSWLVLGPARIQSAEFAKLALIIVYAYFFARRHISIGHWQNLAVSFAYFLLPVILVLIQPDLGSALVLFGLWAGFLLVSGIRRRHLLMGFLILTILGIAGWHGFLKDYQKERIVALFNPNYDPLGVNYSVIQSKIAIGSAGIFGKGFRQGTQTQLGFLPEAATDFIFAAFTEEWGLLGAVLLLIVFMVMIYRVIKIGLSARGNFAQLICLGTVIMFLFHFALNTGSNLGLLPVVGLPLPFLSYGGSNLLTSALLIGIIQSIYIKSK